MLLMFFFWNIFLMLLLSWFTFWVSKICTLSHFFQNQKLICIFLKCRSEFFLLQKQICIFLRCRSKFFFNIADFEIKKRVVSHVLFVWFISSDVFFVLFNASSVGLFHGCSPLIKRNLFLILFNIKNRSYFFFFLQILIF